MSYSFSVSAPTVSEASAKASAEFDKVLAAQPIHEKDLPNARAQADELLGMMGVDETRDVYLSASGSIWIDEKGIRSVSVSTNVSRIERAKAQP